MTMVYPEGSDPVTPLQDAIKDAIPAAFLDLSDSDVFTPAGSVTLMEATASVLPGVIATVQLRLGNVSLSAGQQNVAIGTIATPLRPRTDHANILGWSSTGEHISGLVNASSGEVTIRWSAASADSASILNGNWPV